MIVKNIAYIDTETTGLDPVNDSLIELHIVSYNEKGKRSENLFKFSFDESKANKKALEVNRYYERKKEWKNALSFPEQVVDIYHILKGKDIVGHNVSFDARFLEENFRKVAYVRVPWRRTVDTYSIARFVLPNLKKHSLDNLRKFFRINSDNNHTAEKDVYDMMTVIKKMELFSSSAIIRLYYNIMWKLNA